MKITQHNILAVACATLLLILALAPASANARDRGPQGTRYAQSDAASNTQDNDRKQDKRAARGSDSQNETTEIAQNNNRNSNKQQDQRAPRDSDSPSEAPAISRSEAAAIAERATGGRVLSVRESGRYWQVKVLVDDKRVRFVNVDMRSGRVR